MTPQESRTTPGQDRCIEEGAEEVKRRPQRQ